MTAPRRTPVKPPAPLPIAPTEEAWRAMGPAERERFLIQVNDAARAISSDRLARVVDAFEAKAEQAEAKAEQAEAKAKQAVTLLEQAVSSTQGNLLTFLAARGIPASDDVRARVMLCDDLTLLQRWLVLALSATSAADIFSEPSP